MRQNQNQNPRQPGEQNQRQPTQQQPTQRPPQQQPPQQPHSPPPQSSPPTQRQPPQGQQPMQSSRGISQGQPSPPQQGGQPSRQPPQTSPGQGQQMPTGGGIQQGAISQQGQPQQGIQPGAGAQQPQQMGRGSSHLQSVSLHDILQEDAVTADPDTPLPTITSQMKSEDVGSVIITEDEEPQGIVTDRKVALSLEEMPDLTDRTGEDLMSDTAVVGEETMSVYEALQQMSDENIRRLPIVDGDGRLVGIVTLDDILVLLGEELQDSTKIIKQQSPRL